MIHTPRLVIVRAAHEHAHAQLAYYERNRVHLAPWEPLWPDDLLTLGYWQRTAARALDDARADRAYRFIALDVNAPDRMLASVNLNNVVRGAFEAAHLGYSVDGAHEGRGIGREAVGAVVAHAFGALALHRVMANYMPTNERSGRLLRRLGFAVEGYARDYLFVAGAWRDHVLTARIAPAGDHTDPPVRP